MVPMVGRVCHGGNHSPTGEPPAKGFIGLFEGFSTVGRVRDQKAIKKPPKGLKMACNGWIKNRRQSQGPW